MSQIRQNYSQLCEAEINKQINLELYASYTYQSMAYHFNRDDIASEGYHGYFKKQSAEELAHARQLMTYQNSRGGRLVFQDIKAPEKTEWGSGADALETALHLEKEVNDSLLKLHKTAEEQGDPHLEHFLDDFLDEQVKSIKEIGDLLTQAKRCGTGLGSYQFDQTTMKSMS